MSEQHRPGNENPDETIGADEGVNHELAGASLDVRLAEAIVRQGAETAEQAAKTAERVDNLERNLRELADSIAAQRTALDGAGLIEPFETDSQKMQAIAKDYDLSDPTQVGLYREAVGKAGISTSGIGPDDLKDLASGKTEFKDDIMDRSSVSIEGLSDDDFNAVRLAGLREQRAAAEKEIRQQVEDGNSEQAVETQEFVNNLDKAIAEAEAGASDEDEDAPASDEERLTTEEKALQNASNLEDGMEQAGRIFESQDKAQRRKRITRLSEIAETYDLDNPADLSEFRKEVADDGQAAELIDGVGADGVKVLVWSGKADSLRAVAEERRAAGQEDSASFLDAQAEGLEGNITAMRTQALDRIMGQNEESLTAYVQSGEFYKDVSGSESFIDLSAEDARELAGTMVAEKLQGENNYLYDEIEGLTAEGRYSDAAKRQQVMAENAEIIRALEGTEEPSVSSLEFNFQKAFLDDKDRDVFAEIAAEIADVNIDDREKRTQLLKDQRDITRLALAQLGEAFTYDMKCSKMGREAIAELDEKIANLEEGLDENADLTLDQYRARLEAVHQKMRDQGAAKQENANLESGDPGMYSDAYTEHKISGVRLDILTAKIKSLEVAPPAPKSKIDQLRAELDGMEPDNPERPFLEALIAREVAGAAVDPEKNIALEMKKARLGDLENSIKANEDQLEAFAGNDEKLLDEFIALRKGKDSDEGALNDEEYNAALEALTKRRVDNDAYRATAKEELRRNKAERDELEAEIARMEGGVPAPGAGEDDSSDNAEKIERLKQLDAEIDGLKIKLGEQMAAADELSGEEKGPALEEANETQEKRVEKVEERNKLALEIAEESLGKAKASNNVQIPQLQETIAELKAELDGGTNLEKMKAKLAAWMKYDGVNDETAGVKDLKEEIAELEAEKSGEQKSLVDYPTREGSARKTGSEEMQKATLMARIKRAVRKGKRAMQNGMRRMRGNRAEEERVVSQAQFEFALYEALGGDKGIKEGVRTAKRYNVANEFKLADKYEMTGEDDDGNPILRKKSTEGGIEEVDYQALRQRLVESRAYTSDELKELADDKLLHELMDAHGDVLTESASLERQKTKGEQIFDFNNLKPEERRELAKNIYGSRMKDWDDKTVSDALKGNSKLQDFFAGAASGGVAALGLKGVETNARALGNSLYVIKSDLLPNNKYETEEETKLRRRRLIGAVGSAAAATGMILTAGYSAYAFFRRGEGAALGIGALGDDPASHGPNYDWGMGHYEHTPVDDNGHSAINHHPELDSLPAIDDTGEITADEIGDSMYHQYMTEDKITETSMQGAIDTTSTETAWADINSNAQEMPEASVQVALADLSDDVREQFFGPGDINDAEYINNAADRLHDDQFRADVLNAVNESGSTHELVDGVTGTFHNWGAEAVAWDENGNVTDTRLVQSELHLEDATLVKVTNPDGRVSWFNAECANYLTESPTPGLPIVEAPPIVPIDDQPEFGKTDGEKSDEENTDSWKTDSEKTDGEKAEEKTDSEKSEEKTDSEKSTEKTDAEKSNEEKTDMEKTDAEKSEEKTDGEKSEEKTDSEKSEETTDEKDWSGGVDTAPGIDPNEVTYDPARDDTEHPSVSGNGTESPSIGENGAGIAAPGSENVIESPGSYEGGDQVSETEAGANPGGEDGTNRTPEDLAAQEAINRARDQQEQVDAGEDTTDMSQEEAVSSGQVGLGPDGRPLNP